MISPRSYEVNNNNTPLFLELIDLIQERLTETNNGSLRVSSQENRDNGTITYTVHYDCTTELFMEFQEEAFSDIEGRIQEITDSIEQSLG